MKNLIVDGNNIASVCYFSLHDLANEDSTLYDFNQRIKNYIDTFKIDKVYICWDGHNGSAWRKDVYPDYKANRKERDPNLIESINFCKNNKYKNITVDESEGDDIIYAVCKVLKDEENYIFSSDKDLIQIVQEKYATVIINPLVKLDNIEGKSPFREIPDYDICVYKSIVSDSSDGIKGVKGKGDKFALRYFNGEVELNDEEEKERKLCESIIRLSLNPSKDKIFDEVAKLLKEAK